MKRKFKILYTHQKAKKKKVWQDGYLTLTVDEARGFLSDEDEKQLSTVYLNKKEVSGGVDLESDKYLIQVEEEISRDESSKESTQNSQTNSDQVKEYFAQSAQASQKCSKVRSRFTVPKKAMPKPTEQQPIIEATETHQIGIPMRKSIWSSIATNGTSLVKPTAKPPELVATNVRMTSSLRETSQLLELLEGRSSEEAETEILAPHNENASSCKTSHDDVIVDFPSFLDDESSVAVDRPPSGQGLNKLQLRNPWRKPRELVRENLLRLDTDTDDVVPSEASQIKERMKKEIFLPTPQNLDFYRPSYSSALPLSFTSADEYVRAWREVTYENLNIQVWDKLRTYHSLMDGADISSLLGQCDDTMKKDFVLDPPDTSLPPIEEDFYDAPPCDHDVTCKVARVTKPGPNTGRFFFTCARGKRGRCKFFKWAGEHLHSVKASSSRAPSCGKVKIRNERSLASYLKRNDVTIFTGCATYRKPYNEAKDVDDDSCFPSGNRHTLIKFLQPDRSLCHVKDDLWILSKSFHFDVSCSLVVKVTSASVSASGEVAAQPLGGYAINEWNGKDKVNVLLVSKSTLEFNLFQALSDQIHSLPLLPHLLGGADAIQPAPSIFKLSKPPPVQRVCHKPMVVVDMEYDEMLLMVGQHSREYKLNDDQMAALTAVADVMKDGGRSTPPIVIVDGVVGSGKTFLLSVVIKFIFDLVAQSANQNTAEKAGNDVIGGNKRSAKKWKILVASNTDAKVDGVLRCLLKLGFEKLVRVGNLDRISGSLLPYSVHDRGGSDGHLKKLKAMLRRCGQFDPERHYIKKSIELVECGATKRILHNAFVVGATFDGALSPSIGYYKFPIMVVDDACSVAEPLTLLPLARFSCEKLVLAGDSKLSFKSANQKNLQRSLFQRLLNCGYESIPLTTQWRYNSDVTSLLNCLYYDDTIVNASSVKGRPPLLEGLPRVCLFDVIGKEELKNPGDLYNVEEAKLIADIIKLLLSHAVPGANIVVMTTYEAQVAEIKSELDDVGLYDMSDVRCIAVTTHALYNLDEREISIVSCVNSASSSGDESDRKILSVLTRARSHVIMVGNVTTLSANQSWKKVIDLLKRHQDGVQSSFQFRRFFQKNINSCENKMNDEVPFLARMGGGGEGRVSPARDDSDQLEVESSKYDEVDSPMTYESYRSHDDEDEDSDVIPVLRSKRRRFMIKENDDDDKEQSLTD